MIPQESRTVVYLFAGRFFPPQPTRSALSIICTGCSRSISRPPLRRPSHSSMLEKSSFKHDLPSQDTERMKTRVLFVCHGNTCRSVFAEHLARQKFGHTFDPASAGLYPQDASDTIHALAALREFGIDIPFHQPRAVRYADPHSFDRVVTMDVEVYESFLEAFPGFPASKIERWDITDPWDNPVAYKVCVEQVFAKVSVLASRLEAF